MNADAQIRYWAHMLDEAMGTTACPEFLYHATASANAASIEKDGIVPGKAAVWKGLSRKGVTYWAISPLLAALYVSMKRVPTDKIAVYRAPAEAFDGSKLRADRNYPEREKPSAFEYEGTIPPERLERVDLNRAGPL